MRLIHLLPIGVALLLAVALQAQPPSFTASLDSGKQEFKTCLNKEYPDYSKAYRLLRQAVTLDSTSAEAHYFLGYVLERINMQYGMDSVGRPLSEEASREFETVIKVQPRYSGERLVLDPYSKLTAIWGSLALNYLEEAKQDSAVWAFREGRKRGGFTDALLLLGKSYLQSCKSNALLISNGDVVTFPLHYLQEVERLRPDVLVMDANMFSTDWFPIYLRKQKSLALSFTDDQLHNMPLYREWKPTKVVVKNPKNPKVNMEWVVKPSLSEKYLHRQSEVLLDVLKQNLYKRPVSYTDEPDVFSGLSLNDYFVPAGMVTNVATVRGGDAYKAALPNLQAYSLGRLTKEEVLLSPDAFEALSHFRSAFMLLADRLYGQKRLREAGDVLRLMDKSIPEGKLPFYNQQTKDLYQGLKSLTY